MNPAAQRRAVTIPAMLAATAAAVAGLPLLAPLAFAADVVRLRLRLPTLRVYLFLLQYLVNDSVEILAALILWLRAGLGTSLRSPASVQRHLRVQEWSLVMLARRARQLLGLNIVVTEHDLTALTPPGPVIVVSRHVSVFDAALPALVCGRRHLRVRGVLMAELLTDPGFDLIYRRTGSVFIPRDEPARAEAEIATMTADAGEHDAFVIFPEGRLFRPDVLARRFEQLGRTDPERAERLRELSRTLPPRPGGLLAMLDALPSADVVVIDHRGLDRCPRLLDLIGAVPVEEPVRLRVDRIPRAAIPTDRAGRVRWLDDLWLELDART